MGYCKACYVNALIKYRRLSSDDNKSRKDDTYGTPLDTIKES